MTLPTGVNDTFELVKYGVMILFAIFIFMVVLSAIVRRFFNPPRRVYYDDRGRSHEIVVQTRYDKMTLIFMVVLLNVGLFYLGMTQYGLSKNELMQLQAALNIGGGVLLLFYEVVRG